LTSLFDAVFVWNHLSDDADLHPYWNERTDSLDTTADFKEQHCGTSYTGESSRQLAAAWRSQ
jgi:hypothetical protein